MLSSLVGISVVYSVMFLFLVIISYLPQWRSYRVYVKAATSAVFVSMAIVGVVTSGTTGRMLVMLLGFLSCMIGDILLGVVNKEGKKKYMMGGAIAFMAGHIWYVIGIGSLAPFTWQQFLIPCLAVVLMFFLLKIPTLHPGRMRPYAMLYSFFVSLLFSKGLFVLLTGVNLRAIFIFVGVSLFLISDFIIIFLYFGEKKNKILGFFNMLTYFLAQYFLALTMFF